MYLWTSKIPLNFGNIRIWIIIDPKTEKLNFAALFIVFRCGQRKYHYVLKVIRFRIRIWEFLKDSSTPQDRPFSTVLPWRWSALSECLVYVHSRSATRAISAVDELLVLSPDIDECSAARSPCEQVCVNEPGSYRCSCRHGFTVMTDDPRRCVGAS